MRIFRAVGLGLVIIILRVLMPTVFSGMQDSLITFFGLVKSVLTMSDQMVHTLPAAVAIPQMLPMP